MIKIDNNNEVVNVFEIIRNNLENTFCFWSMSEKYKKSFVTPKIKKSFAKSYEQLGIKNTEILELSASEFYDMPYNKNIELKALNNSKTGIELKYYNLKKGHLEPVDFGNKDIYLKNYTSLAYYDKDIKSTVIVENGESWMSPNLAEKNTMALPIKKAHGNVLTFGLGIGYFPYNCILKDEVESVTIVEKNSDIIKLFKEIILPQFNTMKTIKIIEGDLFDYYNDAFLNSFDYIFVDVWKNETDGLELYEQMMKKDVSTKNIDYWIEDAILYSLQQYVFLYLKSIMEGKLTEHINDFEDDESIHIIKMVHSFFNEIEDTISTKEQLLYYLNDINVLRNILRSL
ncbi:MAG: hypothetical protein ACERLG_01340 [Sedimentibacter sp.]